jgi:protein-tyrosine phosphatase
MADLTSHDIEGFATMAEAKLGEGHFSCPLITQVGGNLWQGGTPAESPEGSLPDYFQFVVNLHPWERYVMPSGTVALKVPLHDEADIPDPELLNALADWINAVRRIGPVLVHCQAGLNRSALVTGLALVRSGMSAPEALALLRRRSPAVLCNVVFERHLLASESLERDADCTCTAHGWESDG